MVVWKGLMALVAALVVKGEVMEYRRSVCLHRRSELRLHCKHTNPHGFIHVQKVVLGFSNDTHDCTNPDTLTYNASCHVIGTTWPKYLTCELQEECDLHMLGLSLDRCGNRGAYSNFAIVEYKCLQGPTDRISCVYGSACSGNGSWDLANDVTVDGGQQGRDVTESGDNDSIPNTSESVTITVRPSVETSTSATAGTGSDNSDADGSGSGSIGSSSVSGSNGSTSSTGSISGSGGSTGPNAGSESSLGPDSGSSSSMGSNSGSGGSTGIGAGSGESPGPSSASGGSAGSGSASGGSTGSGSGSGGPGGSGSGSGGFAGSGSGSGGFGGSGSGSGGSAGSGSRPVSLKPDDPGSGWTGGGGPGLDSGSVPTHWSPPGVEYYDQDWFLSTYDFGENWEDSDWNSANYNYDATMYYYWSDWWQDYASRYDYSNYETPGDWGQYYSDMDWSSYSDWTPWGEDYPDWSPWRNGGTKDGRPERRKRQALESTLLQKIIPGGHFSTLQYGDLSNRNGMDTSMIRSRIKREYVPSEAFPAISMYLADWPLLGYIVSPNFPHKYPDNLDGLCHLQTVRGAEIHLQFDRFHIESDDACIWDYLTLRTEHYAVHLCDKLMPGTKRSLGTAWAQLHFHTDESVEKSGFLIAYWATHPNGEHAKIGVWCGPLNVTERFLSTFNPEEEVRNHQIQLSAPSSHVDGGSSTGISVTLIGAAIGGILVLIVLVTVVTICLCTRKRNTPAKPMQPAPVIPKVHFEPPPDYSSLSVPPDGRLSTINQYEALNIPPVPPRCAPSAYERPSHTLYHAAPIREQIYDEVNQYQPGSEASYIYPSSNDGRPTGLVAFNNRAYENETFPQNGLCTSDRICDRSPDNNVYSSVHEDYYINMNSPSAM